VLEVMSTIVYTGLNPFNFIRKHFLQICTSTAVQQLNTVKWHTTTAHFNGSFDTDNVP
jgi:hypothetical protein